jgi:hypothetical protein
VWGHGGRTVAVLSMSKQEFSRLDVLLRAQTGGLRLHSALSIVHERYPDSSPTPACAGALLVAEKLHQAARRLRALDGEIKITDRAQRFRRRACASRFCDNAFSRAR